MKIGARDEWVVRRIRASQFFNSRVLELSCLEDLALYAFVDFEDFALLDVAL